MRRKKTSILFLATASILVISYALYVRSIPIAHYAEVFHQFGKDCAQYSCPLQERIRLARQAANHDPEFSEVHAVLGKLLLENGEGEAALESLQTALELDSKNEEALLQLGIYYFNEDDLDRSYRYLRRLIAFYNRNYESRYYLGRIYEKWGNRDAAINSYDNAQSFDLENDRRALVRLEALKVQSLGENEALTQSPTNKEYTSNIERASR